MSEGTHATLVYDGDCGLCSWSVDWLLAHWMTPMSPAVVASQHLSDRDLRALSITRADVDTAVWWIRDGELARGHLAVARALAECGGTAGTLGRWLGRRPLRWLGAMVYPVIVRFRHRIPMGDSGCVIERP